MKALLSLLFLLVSVFPAFTQDNDDPSPEQLAFEAALDLHYDGQNDSALYLFRKFLVDYPQSAELPRAKYNIAYLLVEEERDDEAIPVFEEILRSDYNEMEDVGGLMEAYSLYKHRSANHLFEIYMAKEDYEQAAHYYRLFTRKYPYQHFCGNELMGSLLYNAKAYAELHHKLGKSQKAIRKLAPLIIGNDLASNDYLLEVFIQILEDTYPEQELRHIVTESGNSFVTDRGKNAYFRFQGQKIKVDEFALLDRRSPDYINNLDLSVQQQWEKLLTTHALFVKYYMKN